MPPAFGGRTAVRNGIESEMSTLDPLSGVVRVSEGKERNAGKPAFLFLRALQRTLARALFKTRCKKAVPYREGEAPAEPC